MFTLFRKIRKSLIESGRIRRYSLYALGEIALVVIGILIALQVNNWNEGRKAKQELRNIKNNLKSEFLQNRNVLKDRIALIDQSLDHCHSIISFIDDYPVNLSQSEIDSVLVYTLYYGNFNPSNSSIQELLQSGGLKLLNDDSLKTMLFDWLQMLEDTDEDFKNQDLNASQFLIPYLHENTSMRNIDLQGYYGMTSSTSELISDYYPAVFKDFEFENLMVNHMVWHNIMIKHYQELDQLAVQILKQL